MAYTTRNFKSKSELKRALAAGETVTVYQPGPWGPDVKDGQVFLEGPHYPEPHRWYANAWAKDGKIDPSRPVK